jgi:RHS repeat-associated protein
MRNHLRQRRCGMKTNITRRVNALPDRLSSAAILIAALLCLTGIVKGQTGDSPKRGFNVGGSYALSDVETINTTNGNMIFNFPLGKLPPGRGGLSASVNLLYNSKLWDTHVEYVPDLSNQISPQNFLGQSEAGGWRYGSTFEVELLNRNQNVDDPPQCPDPHAFYIWKLRVTFPDGSRHEFRPSGYGDYYNDGYFTIQPSGWDTGCSGSVHSVTTGMTYFTTDGTYIRLSFPASGDWQGTWTLSMPDGTRVVSTNWAQRIYDRNNNYVEHAYVENYNNTGQPAGLLVDQEGRSVAVQYDTATGDDLIRVAGVNNETLTWTVSWKSIEVNKSYTTTCAGCTQERGGTSVQQFQYPLRVVDRITLPAQSGGLTYVFGYNADTSNPSLGWGEVNSVTLPSAAQAAYGWELDGEQPGESNPRVNIVLDNSPTSKTLSYQQEYDGSSTTATETWQYSISHWGSSITAPDLGTSSESFGDTSYQNANSGLAFTSTRPDGSVVERIWQQNLPFGLNSLVQNNPYVKTEFTSIRDAGGNLSKTAIKDFNYDKNGNVTQVREYDWVDYGSVPRNNGFPTGIPGGAPLKRVTTNSYAFPTADASDTSTNSGNSYWQSGAQYLRKAVTASEVSDGGQVLSRAEFYYDDPGTTGNVTQQLSWDSTKGAYSSPLNAGNSISVSHQYDAYGNPILRTDARGIQTQFVYGDINGFTDLYPTQIRTAYQTGVQRTETREYDFYTGVVTRVTDADNNVSTSTSYDVFGRTTLVRAAEGKPEETRTATEYSDTLRRIIVRSDLNAPGDGKLVSIQHFDQLGRVRLTRQLEDSANQSATDETTGIKVQTRYRFSGTNYYELSSNPYRASSSAGAGGELTMGWSTVKHDQGGRVIEVQTFGGAGLPAPWGGNGASTGTVASSYNASEVTVTDQAGKSRKSVTDALGRLVQVYEDPAGVNYLTSYSYDGLNNLVNVYQGIQTRTFVYDSLKRLSSATNPESGTISYDYDANGNLRHKIDPRLLADNQTHVTTTYDYDSLNRLTTRSYNDGTPTVSNNYDSAPNGKGRLASVSSSVSTYSYNAYDALGRALGGTETIGSQSYTVGYTYDLAGHVLTQTYPSGRTVTNTYDSAGRTNSVSGNLGDGAGRTYSSGITYASGGQMTQEQFGTATPVYNKLSYNSRGQLIIIGETTVNDGVTWNRGKIGNRYSFQCNAFDPACAGSDNNGNPAMQDIYIPHDDQESSSTSWFQLYHYDSLNRLKDVGEPGNPFPGIQQAYQYDQYGNRTIDQANIIGAVPHPEFAVDQNTNRLGVPNGQPGAMTYDAAGNLTFDSYTGEGSRVYDAENRMTQAWANNQWQVYSYDAGGRRVKRNVSGTEIWQVYGLGGELVAEYAANTDAANPQKEYVYRNGQLLVTAEPSANIHWLVTDQLGTPRMIFDNTGSLSGVSRHDYLPFGEELFAGTTWRRPELGYTGDGTRQKFTSKERDTETGLDFFEARYYSSTQGRFTSVDPLMASGRVERPQSWNRYGYVYNNPLRFIDPSGEDPEDELLDHIHRIKRTTTTQVTIQERGRGQVVQQATITITETQNRYVDDSGNEVGVDPVQTTATAENTGNAPRAYSADQLSTMANIGKNIVEVSREKGFDPATALGIAVKETRMGTTASTEGVAWKNSEINPMQLSGGLARGGTLRSNIAGAIDVFNGKAGPTEADRLGQYRGSGNAVVDANYATSAQGYINAIRSSVQQKVDRYNNWDMRNYRPPRVGTFPIWRPE